MLPREIEVALRDLTGADVRSVDNVSGGCIHRASRVQTTSDSTLFVKHGEVEALPLFEVEADGLTALRNSHAIRVPDVLQVGATSSHAFIALEWLELRAADQATDVLLGRQLAQLHRCTGPSFGWHRDNFIGRTPQINERSMSWSHFWIERRLRPQLQLAHRNGAGGAFERKSAAVLQVIGELLHDHQPAPSLIHGDLWGGNRAALGNGSPVIFDPAAYYADREVELAMCRLFGGFSSAFYTAYEEAWPLPPDAAERLPCYQLYHVLNHFNLFGGGYLLQAERMMDEVLRAA